MEDEACVWYLGCSAIKNAFYDEAGDIFLFHDFHDVEDIIKDAAESGGVIEGYEDCGVTHGGLNIDGFGSSFAEFRCAFFASCIGEV